MPKSLEEKLKERGWTDEEIAHAISIMRSEDQKGRRVLIAKRMNPVLYWMSLIVAIIGNFVISIVLIPFLLVLSSYQLYIIIAVLALAFGAMFNLLTHTIEHVDPAHHVVAGIFIPALAIITVFVMVSVATRISSIVFRSPIHESPIIVSVFYVLFFMLPYLITKIIDVLRARKKAGF